MSVYTRSKKLLAITTLMMIPFILILSVMEVSSTLMSIWNNVLAYCVSQKDIFISYLFHPDTAMIVIIGMLIGTGLVYGLLFFIKQVYKVYRLKNELSKNAINAREYGSIENNMMIVNDKRPFALTFGIFRPIIYISNGLLIQLTPEESRSVITHERYHQKNNHPVSVLMLNTLRSMLFFLPLAKSIVSKITIQFELLADKSAIAETSRSTLARALVKTLEGDKEFSGYSSAVASFTAFHERVEAITNESESVRTLKASHFSTIFSLSLILTFSFFLLQNHTEFAEAHSNNEHSASNEEVYTNYCNGPEQSLLTIIQSSIPSAESNMSIGGVISTE
jgi:beta-lactamase regulating signal transducer with metallopeptidase domain